MNLKCSSFKLHVRCLKPLRSYRKRWPSDQLPSSLLLLAAAIAASVTKRRRRRRDDDDRTSNEKLEDGGDRDWTEAQGMEEMKAERKEEW